MIEELAVRNLAVIESARIEPGPGLTVITGETGAGKTLLVGALRLLLGGEARSELVGPFEDEAMVEGRFVDGAGTELGAGRRLPRAGRSRAYLDGSIASARALEEAAAGLVDLIGQNDHLSLTRPVEARELVDRSLDASGVAALTDYGEAWDGLAEVRADRRELGGDVSALARELDLVAFQADEITRAGFAPDEDVELGRTGERLRNAGEIVAQLADASTALDNAREACGEAVAALRRALRLDEGLGDLEESLSAATDGLADLARDLRAAFDGVEDDPGQLELVDARLNLLGDLRRKYGKTLDDILSFGEEAARRETEIRSLMERAGVIDHEMAEAEGRVAKTGVVLRTERHAAGERVAAEAIAHLRDLGFTDPVVRMAIVEGEPGPSGADSVAVMFASDSRLKAGPVAQVASGGELSRLVLALRLAGGKGEAPTLVFDEVDAGIGGITALALGRKLAALATERQVLCVTHLPQLAAYAGRHYVVSREGNAATVRRVDGDDRVAELTRMLAGLPQSDRGREAAEELLALAITER